MLGSMQLQEHYVCRTVWVIDIAVIQLASLLVSTCGKDHDENEMRAATAPPKAVADQAIPDVTHREFQCYSGQIIHLRI
jgi:hypothetical protein